MSDTPKGDKAGEMTRLSQEKFAEALLKATELEGPMPSENDILKTLKTAGKVIRSLLAEIKAIEAVHKASKKTR